MNDLIKALEVSKKMSKDEFIKIEKEKGLTSKDYNLKYCDDFFDVYLNKDSYKLNEELFYSNDEKSIDSRDSIVSAA